MATLIRSQVEALARAAGFSGNEVSIITAISYAESRWISDARNYNRDGSVDRGILQINNRWWPQFSDAMCDDPPTAFRLGYIISRSGTYFDPWSSYKSGVYLAYMDISPHPSDPHNPTPWTPSQAASIWPWLVPLDGSHITQFYNPPTETGIDLGVPMSTPITSLTYGIVLSAGYYGGGGVVAVATEIPIGDTGQVSSQFPYVPVSVYYQHLDTIAVAVNEVVEVGALIGTSGGQLSGGQHPSDPAFSSGPHIEIGINAPYGALWHPLGSNRNPLPWLQDLVANGPPFLGAAPPWIANPLRAFQAATSGYTPLTMPLSGVLASIDAAMAIQVPSASWQNILPWNWGQDASIQSTASHDIAALMLRGMFMLTGLMIIIAFIFHIFSAISATPEVQAAGNGLKSAADVAALAAV